MFDQIHGAVMERLYSWCLYCTPGCTQLSYYIIHKRWVGFYSWIFPNIMLTRRSEIIPLINFVSWFFRNEISVATRNHRNPVRLTISWNKCLRCKCYLAVLDGKRISSCYQIFTQLKISTAILSIKIIGQLGTGKRGLCNLIKNVLSVVGFVVRAMTVCVCDSSWKQSLVTQSTSFINTHEFH